MKRGHFYYVLQPTAVIKRKNTKQKCVHFNSTKVVKQ